MIRFSDLGDHLLLVPQERAHVRDRGLRNNPMLKDQGDSKTDLLSLDPFWPERPARNYQNIGACWNLLIETYLRGGGGGGAYFKGGAYY